MKLRHCFLSLFALALIVASATSPVHAQTRVGEAAVVKNDVVRVAGPSTSQINVGDGLLRDEVVRAGVDSAARLVMADSTNLSLGPSATIKLDRTFFNDEHSYREIAIRMTSGAFRFVTGHSEKAAPFHVAMQDSWWARRKCAFAHPTHLRKRLHAADLPS